MTSVSQGNPPVDEFDTVEAELEAVKAELVAIKGSLKSITVTRPMMALPPCECGRLEGHEPECVYGQRDRYKAALEYVIDWCEEGAPGVMCMACDEMTPAVHRKVRHLEDCPVAIARASLDAGERA